MSAQIISISGYSQSRQSRFISLLLRFCGNFPVSAALSGHNSSMTIQWLNNHSKSSKIRIVLFYYGLLVLQLFLFMPISFLNYTQTLVLYHMYSQCSSLTFLLCSASNLLTTFQLKYASAFLCLWWSCFFRSFYSNVFIHPLFIALSLYCYNLFKIGKWLRPPALDFKIYNVLCGLI